ncbi:MAG: VUT family protein, partial [Duncaniella sp.]|nr:VUT family protein [Duncaniella sp.]
MRAIVSSLWGEGVDSVIFFPIAFGGILAWNEVGMLIVTQTFLKTFYEVLILPVTMRVVKMLRDHEGGDVTDNDNTSYKWWRINEI